MFDILIEVFDYEFFKDAINLMKGKALRKHSLHEKTAASVLLKLFMNDATPLTPLAHERKSISKCEQHTCTLHDP